MRHAKCAVSFSDGCVGQLLAEAKRLNPSKESNMATKSARGRSAAKRATARKSATRKSAAKSAGRKSSANRRARSVPQDALALLRADHDAVLDLFRQFEKADGSEEKQQLADEICQELKIHTTIEEEIFYPEVRGGKSAGKAEDALDEAQVEHDGAKKLIAEIENSQAGAELFDAQVTVLSEYIKHHVKEEYDSIFPAARKSGVDLREMGERLRARKEELKGGQ
jgi:hemerythrin-like domain-containing protein